MLSKGLETPAPWPPVPGLAPSGAQEACVGLTCAVCEFVSVGGFYGRASVLLPPSSPFFLLPPITFPLIYPLLPVGALA